MIDFVRSFSSEIVFPNVLPAQKLLKRNALRIALLPGDGRVQDGQCAQLLVHHFRLVHTVMAAFAGKKPQQVLRINYTLFTGGSWPEQFVYTTHTHSPNDADTAFGRRHAVIAVALQAE